MIFTNFYNVKHYNNKRNNYKKIGGGGVKNKLRKKGKKPSKNMEKTINNLTFIA